MAGFRVKVIPVATELPVCLVNRGQAGSQVTHDAL